MKRTGFKPRPKPPRHEPMAYTLRVRPNYARCTVALPVPKEAPVRSEAYRRLVASLPCIHCGIQGFSQHAHANTGKGAGIKTDDRRGFPLCCARPGEVGCHAKFDQGALFLKADRREIEQVWIEGTARTIFNNGEWPARVPLLPFLEDSPCPS